jgi:hypothetical protein
MSNEKKKKKDELFKCIKSFLFEIDKKKNILQCQMGGSMQTSNKCTSNYGRKQKNKQPIEWLNE